MEFSLNFINSLISSAKEHRKYSPNPKAIPDSFRTIQNGKDELYNALLFEAHKSMQEPINDYTEPLLCCVDLDLDKSGIITKFVSEVEVEVTYANGEVKEYNNVHELKIFTSPIPYDRHLNAIQYCNPTKLIEHSLLTPTVNCKITVPELKALCKQSGLKVSGLKQELINRLIENYAYPKITIYHGPPGTGKTYTVLKLLVKMLSKLPLNHRFIICAPSNVGTINMYTRARDLGINCTLVMREDKIPAGTIITDEEREKWNPKTARIVFSTVSGRCGSILKREQFHSVIIDEAAQCQEAWAWGLLRTEVINLIMAGDPYQLPAQVSQDGKDLNYGISLMERLMKIGHTSILLNTQRRMHPNIVEFPNQQFYNSKLLTNFDINENYSIKPYEIISIQSNEEKTGTSFSNEIEAKLVISLANKLKQTFNDTIVISPYKGQCELLQKLDPSLIIHTVDSFQGKEADAIIISTVRSGKNIGFWQDYRRLNVALTRAKHVLRIIGSINTWKSSNSVMTSLANYADENAYVKTVSPVDLLKLNIDIRLIDIKHFLNTTIWNEPIIDSRVFTSCKSDLKLEHILAKTIVKLCIGTKHKSTSLVSSTVNDNVAVDWCVIIDENSMTTKLRILNVRYNGTNTNILSDAIKTLEKNGPEWNEICKYECGPTSLSSLPFRGKRPPPKVPEIPRNRNRERFAAQNLVASFRR